MKEKELYTKLKEAYLDENLNRITGKLIELYKSKKFGQILTLANKIFRYELIDENKDAKCFYKLIMLYHPDKGEYYRKTIDQSFENGNMDKLEEFLHIFLLDDFENCSKTIIDNDIEYNPEYEWDYSQTGYNYFSDTDEKDIEEFNSWTEYDKTFYNAVKLRVYGNLEVEFPPYYLEDLDEVELAGSNIESLEGIEYCKHTITLDLSSNDITDITDLCHIERLEELYLANNSIGYIDALSSLFNLRIIDLSGNDINDISPLFPLEKLEYVNLIGNNIPSEQIIILQKKDVMIMHESLTMHKVH